MQVNQNQTTNVLSWRGVLPSDDKCISKLWLCACQYTLPLNPETQMSPDLRTILETATLKTVWTFGKGGAAQGHLSCGQLCGGPDRA